MVASIVLGILLLGFLFSGSGLTGGVITGGTIGVSADVVGEKFASFAESSGVPVEVLDVKKSGDFYEVSFSSEQGDSSVFVTLDGKNLVNGLIPLDSSPSDKTASSASVDVPKSDKPEVELYVFTYCPYGTQSEKGMIPAVKLLGDKIDFKIRQVGAMHGEYEKVEAMRQLCVEKEYPIKFLDYVLEFALDAEIGGCGSNAVCSEPLVNSLFTKLGIDKNKINSCMASDGESLYAAEEKNSKSNGVSGSPTLIINGKNVQSGRDSESYLNAICSAFNDVPEECMQELSSVSPSPGFGSGTGSASSAAQC